MIPAVALRGPHNLAAIVRKSRKSLARIYVVVRLLTNQHALHACDGIHLSQLDRLFPAFAVIVENTLAVRIPVESRATLKAYFQWRGLNVRPVPRRYIENNGLRRR